MNIQQNERHYPFCKPDIAEDKNHALLVCGKYNNIKKIFFNKVGNSNEIHDMNSTEKL